MDIKDLMQTDVRRVHTNANLQEAARLLWEADCGALPVVNDSHTVVGMITDRDIAMACYLQDHPPALIRVHEAMSPSLHCIDWRATVKEAERMMAEYQVRRLPVLDEQKRLVGMLSINDLAIAYRDSRGKQVKADALADTLAAICLHRPHASAA